MINWSEYFYYDETSPSCLRRSCNRYCGAGHGRLVAAKDAVVGIMGANGYYMIPLNGKHYYAHRIIWELLNGEIPSKHQIDHINRDRSCNLISNLRVVTKQENSQNLTRRSDNISGVTGVSLTKNGDIHYWTACIVMEGKNIKKHFSINKLGNEEALKAAIDYRNKAIEDLNSIGHNYTNTHGE